jgi:methyl-accepting chemotaxis protein
VGLGLMVGADVLVHVGGGLTDLHIWSSVLVPLVALYRMWTPFLLAVGFVTVHHTVAGIGVPEPVFSAHARHDPMAFVALHAVFVLLEAIFLAYGWKFAERLDRERRAQQRLAGGQQVAQARAELELAEERARAADEAARQLLAREERTARLAEGIADLVDAGQRLDGNVTAATEVREGLRSAIAGPPPRPAARAPPPARRARGRAPGRRPSSGWPGPWPRSTGPPPPSRSRAPRPRRRRRPPPAPRARPP